MHEYRLQVVTPSSSAAASSSSPPPTVDMSATLSLPVDAYFLASSSANTTPGPHVPQ